MNEIVFNDDGKIRDQKYFSFLTFNSESEIFKLNKRSYYVFENCDFYQNFEIINIEFLAHANLSFINCRFHENSKVAFVSCKLQVLSFRNCTFKNSLYINNINCYKLLMIEVSVNHLICNFNKIDDFIFKNETDLEIKEFELFGDDVNDFELVSIAPIGSLKIKDCVNGEINANIIKLDLSCDSVKSLKIGPDIYDETKVVKELSFAESTFSGSVYFQNISCEELTISKVTSNQGLLSFNEIEVENALFEDVLISNIHFDIIKFKHELTFERCNLSGAKLFNVEWLPNKSLSPNFLFLSPPLFQRFRNKTFEFENEEFSPVDLKALKYQRDTFRQLKAASIANGNNIDALSFYRNEMRLFWKEIRINGGQKWYDFILIFLNRWSSDFGQNWFLPIIWLIILNSYFYWLLELPHLSFSPLDWKNGLLKVLNYIYPLRELSESNTDAQNGFDFFIRAINAYLIYHFIKASRKYGKP